MRLKQVILASCIVLCLSCSGCATRVRVINFSEKEFFTMKKEDVTYHCMSDYYVEQVLRAKIDSINPK